MPEIKAPKHPVQTVVSRTKALQRIADMWLLHHGATFFVFRAQSFLAEYVEPSKPKSFSRVRWINRLVDWPRRHFAKREIETLNKLLDLLDGPAWRAHLTKVAQERARGTF